jgi:hypothetical protein
MPDLPQQVHNLFCTILLSSRHLPLLLFQFVSPPLAQIEPGTPGSVRDKRQGLSKSDAWNSIGLSKAMQLVAFNAA